MQAIILAAGMGKRLKDLTADNCKCMVKVNGVSLIERTLRFLDDKNLNKIVVVIGYEAEKLSSYIKSLNINTPIEFVDNTVYDKTNNIYSLQLAKDYLIKDDTLLFESDVIFESAMLDDLINDPRPTLALVDKFEPWMDGTCVTLDEEDNVVNFIPGKKFDYNKADNYYKTVNIYKFSKDFSKKYYVPFLEAYTKALGNNEYYEQVLKVISILDNPNIKCKRVDGRKWYEIDDKQDLDIACTLFAENKKQKLDMMSIRYGGYWRYTKMIDFCYLVNPYFPPKKLIDEIKFSMDALIRQYPSGMGVNSLIASKNFNINQKNIIVGNGAAELINHLMSQINGKIGVIRPTFEEYPNRYDSNDIVVYNPQGESLSYTYKDVVNFFDDKDIDNLIIINPDNPSGNYIPKNDLLKLIEWANNKKIRIVVDESFVDFADEEDATIIDQQIIDKYDNLIIVKSISKSYGVPGIRLGVLVSSNVNLIKTLNEKISIWNINSFGEYYMQIYEKYKKDYKASLDKLKAQRNKLVNELSKLPNLKVFNSQANYIMLKLTNGLKARDITENLLWNHNIYIKNLDKKISSGEYLRIAIRDENDNNNLIKALKEELEAK